MLWHSLNAKAVSKIIERRVMLIMKTKVQHMFLMKVVVHIWNHSFDNKKNSEWQSINHAVHKSAVSLQLTIFSKSGTRGNWKNVYSHDQKINIAWHATILRVIQEKAKNKRHKGQAQRNGCWWKSGSKMWQSPHSTRLCNESIFNHMGVT